MRQENPIPPETVKDVSRWARITLRMPRDLHAALADRASSVERPRAQVIREALHAYLGGERR